ncbi:RNA polymerase sigma-70 factor (ECF subfamily) [Kribbella amoyensis]|uniref:RNA polymerase sigma-70 factor (ECF subfamily) n=1 Tax=Kribbella amoyensis TaxID=996641 RepID=A0A561BUB2_9ACTN|nr:sigma-70 family RNA polymerase sigma factor [Kribbella amoyensis]TWD82520.1 RNA polymerase sigma-70 factor (ECF subfamily) [Kribbella amoyensis]
MGGLQQSTATAPSGAVTRPEAVDLDEATLVARARDRDPVSFELLVRRYQRRIYTLCLRMLNGATGDAEDVAQETFVTAWRRLPEIRDDAAFGGWLYRTATNKCLTLLQRRRPTLDLDEDNPPPDPRPGGDPERTASSSAAMHALSEALQKLPPPQRACWLLREVHGRSYQEIAELVGTTPTAVRGRIARARAELAEVMKPWR